MMEQIVAWELAKLGTNCFHLFAGENLLYLLVPNAAIEFIFKDQFSFLNTFTSNLGEENFMHLYYV
jgi:hypothetical protein